MDKDHIIGRLKNHTPKILGSENFAKYAVLLPLVKRDDGVSVLFEVRSFKLRRQPGEICFPGGRIDPGDKDEQEAAVRETVEELGIKREAITGIAQLDYMISPFGMIVFPYAGFLDGIDHLKPNEAEVDEVLMVPLRFFMETPPELYHINFRAEPEDNFPVEKIPGGKNYNFQIRHMEEYFYHYEGRIIWGLTARILAHFVEIVKNG